MDVDALFRSPVGRAIVIHGATLLGLCIAVSLLYGSVVVGGPVLYGLGFAVYGGFGYIALGLAVFFLVAMRDELREVTTNPRFMAAGIALGAVAAVVFWRAVRVLNANPSLITEHQILLGLAMHFVFWLGFVLLLYGCFGHAFIKDFLTRFRKPLLVCGAIALVLYACMPLVWHAWPLLSWGVSRCVYVLTTIFPGQATLIPPMTLRVSGFGVLIGEACSGVFAIFLFSALFALLIARDWRRVIPVRAVLLFLLALVGLFFVNVLRVYLIILVGALYDPALAVGLFHSYVGTVLFLIFFVLFLRWCADWMYLPQPRAEAVVAAAPVPVQPVARAKHRRTPAKRVPKKTRGNTRRRRS